MYNFVVYNGAERYDNVVAMDIDKDTVTVMTDDGEMTFNMYDVTLVEVDNDNT